MTKRLTNVEKGYYEEFRATGYIDGLEGADPKLDPEVDNDMLWIEYATGYAEGQARRLRREKLHKIVWVTFLFLYGALFLGLIVALYADFVMV